MVRRTVYRHGLALQVADNTTHVCTKASFQFGLNQRCSILGAEDNVSQKVRKCVGHILSPLRGWFALVILSHGLRRGLESEAPLGLIRIAKYQR